MSMKRKCVQCCAVLVFSSVAVMDGVALEGGLDARFSVENMQADYQSFELAQAPAGGLRVRSSGRNMQIAGDASGSFGSDFTALFRWRRWRNPLREGGVISWLNPGAWARAPYRTLAVLAGELVFIGGTAAIVEASSGSDDGGGGNDPAPAPAPAPSSGGGGSSSSNDDDPAPVVDAGSSGGGSSPAPSEGAGGDELPF